MVQSIFNRHGIDHEAGNRFAFAGPLRALLPTYVVLVMVYRSDIRFWLIENISSVFRDHDLLFYILLAAPMGLPGWATNRATRLSTADFEDLKHGDVSEIREKILRNESVNRKFFLFLRPFTLDV